MKHCTAKNRKGNPCRGYPIAGSNYCFAHDPQRKQERGIARRKGGLNRRTKPSKSGYPGDIAKLADILFWLNRTLVDTWQQENSLQRSRTIGSLLGIARKILVDSEIEERLLLVEAGLQKMMDYATDQTY